VIHVLLSEGCLIGVSVKRGVFQRFSRVKSGSDGIIRLVESGMLELCFCAQKGISTKSELPEEAF